jgi:hypothetical protein
MSEPMDGMCPHGHGPAPLAYGACDKCGWNLVPYVADRPAASPPADRTDDYVATARSVCWYDGELSPNPTNTLCMRCGNSLIPPAVAVLFDDGPVALNRGEAVELGRVGPAEQIFRRYPNVSRRHALLRVDAAGTPWIEPFRDAVNGTFLNDQEIDRPTALVAGHRLRFGSADAGPSGIVRLPDLE